MRFLKSIWESISEFLESDIGLRRNRWETGEARQTTRAKAKNDGKHSLVQFGLTTG